MNPAQIVRDLGKVALHTARLCLPKPSAARVDLTGKNVIVTGASPNSLGFETVCELVRWGANVVATTLDSPERAHALMRQQLEGSNRVKSLCVRHLDLSSPNSVSDFASWTRAHFDNRIHILVNNAGVHRNVLIRRKQRVLSKDGTEIHWRVNFLGTFHLTHELLKSLREAATTDGQARIVCVASHLHDRAKNEWLFSDNVPQDSWIAYGLSKLALIHFSFELHRRYASEGVRAFVLHPGSAHTNLTHSDFDRGKIGRMIGRLFLPLERLVLLHPKHGAQTTLMCASEPDLPGGSYYYRCRPAKPASSAFDTDVSQRLWTRTAGWLDQMNSEA